MKALYQYLLHCYPAAYFREYGQEMAAVFLQAREAAMKRGFVACILFDAREMLSVLSGAAQEWFHRYDSGLWRKFEMRTEFRFPRSTIFLMLLTLVGVFVAIETARRVIMPNSSGISRSPILPIFALCLGFMLIAGTLGYVVLVVLRRTGSDRISNTQTWSRHK